MTGQPIVLNSFQGGLNNVDSISALDNSELHEIVNFDMSSTGTLFGRPPITPATYTPGFDDQTFRNLVKNAGLINDSTDWTSTNGTNENFGRVANDSSAHAGTAFFRCTMTAAGAVVESRGPRYQMYNQFTPGQVYSFGGWFRMGSATARNMYLRIAWMNSSGSVINLASSPTASAAPYQWQRYEAIGLQAPPGAVSALVDWLGLSGQTALANNDYLDADDIIAVVGGVLPPSFDGSFPSNSQYTYSWEGAVGASISKRVSSNAAAPQPMDLLGYFTDDTGTTFVVAATTSKTWLYNPATNVWKQAAPFKAADAVQYQSKLYMVCETTAGGYYGRASTGADYGFISLAASGTNTKPMPKGSQIALYQERFWIAGPKNTPDSSTMFFSNITSTSAGTSINEFVGDFIAVQPGDGQSIQRLIVGQNDLFIFRSRSTWRFIYDATPAQGRLTPISPFVGADSKYSVATRENYIVTLSGGTLYEMVSYVFYPLNVPKKIRFFGASDTSGRSIDYAVSMLGNRAIVWSKGATYVFDTNLRTWTMWDSPTTRGAFFLRYPNGNDVYGADTAFGISARANSTNYYLYRIVDAIGDAKEEMTCQVSTKAYDYEEPGSFKRLWWWGINGATGRDVRGKAIPLGLGDSGISWDTLDTKTWDTLDMGSWDYPIIPNPSIDTTQGFTSAVPAQVFVKMNQGIRFRQCSFTVQLTTDGSTASGPVRIDSLTTWVEVKSKVSKGVS